MLAILLQLGNKCFLKFFKKRRMYKRQGRRFRLRAFGRRTARRCLFPQGAFVGRRRRLCCGKICPDNSDTAEAPDRRRKIAARHRPRYVPGTMLSFIRKPAAQPQACSYPADDARTTDALRMNPCGYAQRQLTTFFTCSTNMYVQGRAKASVFPNCADEALRAPHNGPAE